MSETWFCRNDKSSLSLYGIVGERMWLAHLPHRIYAYYVSGIVNCEKHLSVFTNLIDLADVSAMCAGWTPQTSHLPGSCLLDKLYDNLESLLREWKIILSAVRSPTVTPGLNAVKVIASMNSLMYVILDNQIYEIYQ